MWGDPHMVTCDGLSYDCQGIGIFTLMQNHMWNIQGNFVDVGANEHGMIQGWGLTMGASLANDVALEYVYDDSVPVFQFGFGDLTAYEQEVLWAEVDCDQWQTFDPVDMPGQGRTVEEDVTKCRERCENTDGCIAFHFWQDGGCHLSDGNQQQTDSNPHWSRAVVGFLDNECGIPQDPPEPEHDDERAMHGSIGPDCPLLMWVDGELQDLSDGNDQGFLWGERGDKNFVERVGNSIRVVNELEDGSITEANLIQKGDGPNRLWSCHWDFYICLPHTQQSQFEDYSVGLLGTPDGNTSNDWMDVDGNSITVDTHGHENEFHYCVDNWCVSQADSLMVFAEGNNYNDYKCEHEEFKDFDVDNPNCVLNAEKIEEVCGSLPPLMIHACQVDCCLGGCNSMEEEVEEVTRLVTLEDPEEPEVKYDIPDFSDCSDTEFFSTSDTACPDSGPVVKLLDADGDVPLPDGEEIFYGIVTDMEPHDGASGTTVKFKVNNPFDSSADVYVKHEKSVVNGFMDPHCTEFNDTTGGCPDESHEVEVACRNYDGVAPFAVVTVYFASSGLNPPITDISVDECCEPPEYGNEIGVVQYVFEIQCTCPDTGEAVA